MDSRHVKILNYLKQNGTITGAQAWKMFHVDRLSSVIYRRRNKGYELETIMIEDPNGNGKYAMYRLDKDKEA